MPTTNTNVPIAHQIVKDIRAVHKQCHDNIALANKRYSIAYNRKRRETPEFRVGDLVMLSFENITTLRPSKKLDVKRQGPFKITELIGTHACRLNLPVTMKNHDVFHITLLEAYRPPTFPNQASQPPGPIDVDGDDEYEVANIINSRLNTRTGKLEYLVEWLGYEGTDKHTTWEPKNNVTSSTSKLEEFHSRYPDKPHANSNEL